METREERRMRRFGGLLMAFMAISIGLIIVALMIGLAYLAK
jgi:hypothetical protein